MRQTAKDRRGAERQKGQRPEAGTPGGGEKEEKIEKEEEEEARKKSRTFTRGEEKVSPGGRSPHKELS